MQNSGSKSIKTTTTCEWHMDDVRKTPWAKMATCDIEMSACKCEKMWRVKVFCSQILQSLLVCPIILWKSSLTRVEWISGWRSWMTSRIQSCVWCLAFTHHMRWRVFWRIRNPRIRPLRIKVLKKTPLDLRKRFPIYHACPEYLAACRCGSAFPENGLAFRQDLENVGKTLVDW